MAVCSKFFIIKCWEVAQCFIRSKQTPLHSGCTAIMTAVPGTTGRLPLGRGPPPGTNPGPRVLLPLHFQNHALALWAKVNGKTAQRTQLLTGLDEDSTLQAVMVSHQHTYSSVPREDCKSLPVLRKKNLIAIIYINC